MNSMKRRGFLGLAAAISTVEASQVGTALAGDLISEASLPSLGAMAAIGHRYLRDYPDERDRASALLARLGPVQRLDREGLRVAVAAEMRRDLDHHDVVTVDGWVLPRTLLTLCSAVAIAETNDVC